MLYYLLYPLHKQYAIFNVFKYLTFRTSYAVLTALAISFLIGPRLIKWLAQFPVSGSIRDYVPNTGVGTSIKAQTPTMGGILILIAAIIPTLLWANLNNRYIWLTVFVTVAMGLVGLWDDYLKIRHQSHEGLNGREKLLGQVSVALIAGLYLYLNPADGFTTKLPVPFLKNVRPDIGSFYILLVIIVIVGTSNAVNLSDGLDGLAIGPMIIAIATFMVLSYVAGHIKFANYLMIINIPGSGELTVFCGSLLGASLGFLWFNAYPAQVFMGDIGSLSLGGALGIVALITKNELLLILVGGVFVVETLSVIIQVVSCRLIGRRVFRMAPLHHHYQMHGWEEPKIIVRFWIIAIILALVSLSTLKLR
ncbi:MAG: phospho-N-acetylmuramoyl-pentapeptide-transferase [Candidatus Schekmanbacteria bacterium]|nr:phospho-N-acetylmuramoyl-pentapeptide-transferase [Candidatus Schekmanbacteria bacterium]